ncbi:hypothetical protein RQP46_010631 [Phenoliferia psychrophenolica]
MAPTLPNELIGVVSRSFAAVAQLDLVWRPHTHFWTFHPTQLVPGEAREYCLERARLDWEVRTDLRLLVRSSTGRATIRDRITSRGLLATTALLELAEVAEEDDPEYYLSTRYQANECLDLVRNAAAVTTFTNLANSTDRDRDDYCVQNLWDWTLCIDALAALAAYRGGAIECLPQMLDRIDPLEGSFKDAPVDLPLGELVLGVWKNMGEQGLRPNTVDFDARFLNLLLNPTTPPPFSLESVPFVASIQSSIILCNLLRHVPHHDIRAWPVVHLPATVIAVARGGEQATVWNFFDLDLGRYGTQEDLVRRYGPPPGNRPLFAPTIPAFVVGLLATEIYTLALNHLERPTQHSAASSSLMAASHAMLLIYAQVGPDILPDDFEETLRAAMVVVSWETREGFYTVIDENGEKRGRRAQDGGDPVGWHAFTEESILASTKVEI